MDDNRVVLINGNGSEWYEQVIFILKNPKAAKAKNLVFEAERIINEYLLSGKVSNPRLERYKKNIQERTASSGKNPAQAQSAATPASCAAVAHTPAPMARRYKKTAKRKFDFTSLLINICLVLCSILLGYLMHTMMSP